MPPARLVRHQLLPPLPPELPPPPELPEEPEEPEEDPEDDDDDDELSPAVPVTDWTVPTTAPAAVEIAWVILSRTVEAVSWALEAMVEALSATRRTTDFFFPPPPARDEAPREEEDRAAAAPRALPVLFLEDFAAREADFFIALPPRFAEPDDFFADFFAVFREDFFADFLAALAISAPFGCDVV